MDIENPLWIEDREYLNYIINPILTIEIDLLLKENEEDIIIFKCIQKLYSISMQIPE